MDLCQINLIDSSSDMEVKHHSSRDEFLIVTNECVTSTASGNNSNQLSSDSGFHLLDSSRLFVTLLPACCLEQSNFPNVHHKQQQNGPPLAKFGILKCVARSIPAPVKQQLNEASKEDHKNTSVAEGPASASNGPHIIFLPPIEEPKVEVEGNNQENEHEAREVHLDPADNEKERLSEAANDLYEDYDATKDNDGEVQFKSNENERNQSGQVRPAKLLRVQPVDFNQKTPKRRKSLWRFLEKPFSKLIPSQMERHDGNPVKHHNGRITMRRRRLKRQTNVDVTEQLIRALALDGLGIGNTQATRNAQNILQQVLLSMNLLLQQLMSLFIRQTAADLPIHMSNFGRLTSNLITALTIDNPLLINSPMLLRTRQAANANLESLLRANSSLMINAQEFASNLNKLVRTVAANLPAQTTQASVLSTTVSPVTPTTSMADADNREVVFVNRVNELSLGITRSPGNSTTTVEPRAPRSAGSGDEGKRRTKRSIGSLLMFGPFSKFYLAMMMNRVIKYQSGVFSQAVMGELVKRFVLPGVSSAFGDSKSLGGQDALSGLLQQMKQGISGAANSAPFLQAPTTAAPDRKPSATLAPEPQRLESTMNEEQKTTGSQRNSAMTFDADCQLVNPSHNDNKNEQQASAGWQLPDPQTVIQQIAASPAGLVTAAMNNPAFSLDQQGLSFNLPGSQTKVTVPNLFTGQHSIPSLLRLMAPNMRDGSLGAPANLFPPTNFSYTHHQNNAPHHLGAAFIPTRPNGGELPSASKTDMRYHLQPAAPEGLSIGQFATGNKQQDEVVSKLLDQVATTTKTTALLLDAYLKQASPKQLVEFLAQVNKQQLQTGQQVLSDQMDIGALMSASQRDWISEKDGNTGGGNSQSVNFMADKILNKTLSMGLTRMLAEKAGKPANQSNGLLKETSDLLANSFAELVRGGFDQGALNDHDKVTPGAAKLAHENALLEELAALSKNISLSGSSLSNLTAGDWTSMVSMEPDWQTSAPMLAIGDNRPDWLIQPVESSEMDISQTSSPASDNSHGNHSINNLGSESPSRSYSLGKFEADEEGSIRRDRDDIAEASGRIKSKVPMSGRTEAGEQTALKSAKDLHYATTQVSFNGTTKGNYNKSSLGIANLPPKPVGLSSIPKTSKHEHFLASNVADSNMAGDNVVVVAGQPSGFSSRQVSLPLPTGKLFGSPGAQPFELRKTSAFQQQQQQQQQQRHDTLLAPTKGQAVAQESTSIVDNKTSSSNNQQVRLQPARANKSRQAEDQQPGNLNNLAMALNVMNMVLLNQKLANNNNNNNNSATPTNSASSNNGSAVVAVGQTSPISAKTIGHLFVHQLADLQTNPKAAKPVKLVVAAAAAAGSRNPLKVAPLGNQRALDEFKKDELNPQQNSGKLWLPLGGDVSVTSNHRTSSNVIKQNATLLLSRGEKAGGTRKPGKPGAAAAANRPASYLYQPLVIKSPVGANNSSNNNNNNSGFTLSGSQNQTKSQTGKQRTISSSPDEPEKDHAARWNDVLQHISLAS